jgi:hypothetical protein
VWTYTSTLRHPSHLSLISLVTINNAMTATPDFLLLVAALLDDLAVRGGELVMGA